MTKIVMLKGLPGSGKTTLAKEMMSKNKNYKRVNKDELRAMIDDSKRSKENEKIIVDVRNLMIKKFVSEGFDVIVDDTNLEQKHYDDIKLIADDYYCELVVMEVDTPLEVCLERDANRDKTVGEKVINSMYNRHYIKEFKELPVNRNLPDCIIIDIDGTLAKKGDRDIYDGSKVYLDELIYPVSVIVNQYANLIRTVPGYQQNRIFLVSGRDSKYRQVTIDWLNRNQVYANELYMRPIDDKRPDTEIKKEIYEREIKDKYNVLFVIDDRYGVVNQWREMGMFTLDVNQTREVF